MEKEALKVLPAKKVPLEILVHKVQWGTLEKMLLSHW
jgi:hypothetical protein